MAKGRLEARLSDRGSLHQVLPKLCESLSLARTQIVLDQIRSQISDGNADRIRFLTVHVRDSMDSPLAALIAIAPDNSQKASSRFSPKEWLDSADQDSATILHAGPLRRESPFAESHLQVALAAAVEDDLRQRGVTFVQWATDPIERDGPDTLRQWCLGLGFEPLATLEYVDGPATREPTQETSNEVYSLALERVSISNAEDLARFAGLVEQTYANTLDCPSLADHRSAAQTLNGYRASNAYAPEHWYRALSASGSTVVGCMVLARHGGATQQDPTKSQHDDNPDNQAGGVLEIVYMGLIPSERGRGLGADLVHLAKSIARDEGLDRVILAVDRENVHARTIYHNAGFRSLMTETVWGRSIR